MRSNVVLWFTKGSAGAFCRRRSQLTRGVPRFREVGAEPIVVPRTPLARAQTYAGHFPLAVAFSDADGKVRGVYRLDARPKPARWYLRKLLRLRQAPCPPSDFGPSGRLGSPAGMLTTPAGLVATLADEDTALFVVDRAGTVRFAKAGGMRAEGGVGAMWQLPTVDEIVGALCEASPSRR